MFRRNAITCPFCGYHGRARQKFKGSLGRNMVICGLGIVGLCLCIIPGLIVFALAKPDTRFVYVCPRCRVVLGDA